MRTIGLIIVGALAAGCSGPAPDNSFGSSAEIPAEVAAPNDAASNQLMEPQIAPEPAIAGNSAGSKEPVAPVNPCLLQGAVRLEVAPIRAVGTEPFWGARVEGRCVTYSHPDNQQGVRVWTRYSAGVNGRSLWAGQLGGQKFEMRVRPQAGCSDGMSDKRYPMAVELLVNGEQRVGCAEPL